MKFQDDNDEGIVSRAFVQLNRFLSARRVRLYALMLAAITLLLAIAVYIHVPRFSETPGADFVQFYTASILGRHYPEKMYDVVAQQEIQKQFSPGAQHGIFWPYIHAPFFSIILLPLSRLSYVEAFWSWTVFTGVLYFVSVLIIVRAQPVSSPPLGLTLPLASAAPVFYWLIITGQSTAIALFLWSLGFVLLKHQRAFLAALILGFLSYRAQYLLLVVPLFLVRRAWLGLSGLGASCFVAIVAGGLIFSFSLYPQYVHAVLMQSRKIVTQEQPLQHYITLYGFFRLLLPPSATLICTVICASPLVYWLFRTWDIYGRIDLQWGLLIVATLLLMHHGFVYDLLLLTVPLLLLYGYRSYLPPYYKILLIGLYVLPYIYLITPVMIPINPIQPILYWLCFEIYRVAKKIGYAPCSGASYHSVSRSQLG